MSHLDYNTPAPTLWYVQTRSALYSRRDKKALYHHQTGSFFFRTGGNENKRGLL